MGERKGGRETREGREREKESERGRVGQLEGVAFPLL